MVVHILYSLVRSDKNTTVPEVVDAISLIVQVGSVQDVC
jgi:hypothetical protein